MTAKVDSLASNILQRRGPFLVAEKSRVILRRLYPGSHEAARLIVDRVLSLSDEEAQQELSVILDEWADRHRDLVNILRSRYREICANLSFRPDRAEHVKTLIGAYFMHEYSIESAALFNPSVVPHPDQSGLAPGSLRLIISLRATGEGHVSSVSFREAIVNAHNRISLEQNHLNRLSEAQRHADAKYEKKKFLEELQEVRALTEPWSNGHRVTAKKIIESLQDEFTLQELRNACSEQLAPNKITASFEDLTDASVRDETVQALLLLAEATYTVIFPQDSKMSERVLFPSAPSQSNGIEDARFVLLEDQQYYATFTAYNGRSAVPQLMSTSDFSSITFRVMHGNGISNKGMALFPRKINGRFWMLSRQDDVSVMIMESEHINLWNDPVPLITPKEPWEFFKMGNCGSPIETPKGWLVLTHGVGPMRRYCIGAAMLDLDDPKKIIGRMKKPLIAPNESEREGYVPNVVYSCGCILHNGNEVIIPYAMSDSVSSFATVSLEDLYKAMDIQ